MFYKLRTLRDKHALIVEDEWLIAADFAEAMRAEGARVIGPAATVAEACDLLAHLCIDCAVVDLNLRGEHSYAVADALLDAGIPFVFATGYSTHSIPNTYADVPCLIKPFDRGMLTAALRK